MQNLLLSCDWGTSSFRLKLADIISGKIVDEVISSHGIAGIYKQWCDQPSADRVSFYLLYLKNAVKELSGKTGTALDHITIVISGMVSSTVGLKELAYAGLPFSLDGSDANMYWLKDQTVLPNEILLVSGIGHAQDVMRGEETQLIGIADLHGNVRENETIYIFPGTHSKHIVVQNGKIISSETYMTGEVFDLMAHKSILSASVTVPTQHQIDAAEIIALNAGIQQSGEVHLLKSLFSVRINQLHNYFSKQQNYYFLSGLLIGAELRSIKDVKRKKLVICSGSKVYELYRLAVRQLDLVEQTSFISSTTMDNAAMLGHIKILKHQHIKSI